MRIAQLGICWIVGALLVGGCHAMLTDFAVADAGPVEEDAATPGHDAETRELDAGVDAGPGPNPNDAGDDERDAGAPDADAPPVMSVDAGEPVDPRAVDSLAVGASHACVLYVSGEVACWGYNLMNQVDGSSTGVILQPTLVGGLDDAVEVSAGGDSTCARRASGSIVCWGGSDLAARYRPAGILAPTPVDGISDAVQLSVGGYHGCALGSSGAVSCWGHNSRGQLGDGRTTASRTAVPVRGLPWPVARVESGDEFSCALGRHGQVSCWGYAVITGGGGSALEPTPIVGLGAVELLSAGRTHACVEQDAGIVACWGSNSEGQLLSRENQFSVPATDIPDVLDPLSISAGGFHTCALLDSLDVSCWGSNSSGQLGDGTRESNGEPVAVGGLGPVRQLESGLNHSCALQEDGQVVCWGANGFGQLGPDQPRGRSSSDPVVIGGL